jgi:long-chain fatty acid transport protein
VNGALDTDIESEKRWELLGEVAYSRMMSPDLALGVVGYSNGAGTFLPADTTVCLAPQPAPPGTTFRGNALCGSGRIVSGVKQLIVAPTLSMRLSNSVSVGGSLLLAGQMFKAEGQQALTSQSASPDRVTNRGTAYSFGAGLRVGGYWRAHEMLSLGASWSPRVAMSRFEEYEGLLADRGRFDIPETLMAGLQFSPSPALSLMLDYQRIRYSGTDALANPGFDGSALRGSRRCCASKIRCAPQSRTHAHTCKSSSRAGTQCCASSLCALTQTCLNAGQVGGVLPRRDGHDADRQA